MVGLPSARGQYVVPTFPTLPVHLVVITCLGPSFYFCFRFAESLEGKETQPLLHQLSSILGRLQGHVNS